MSAFKLQFLTVKWLKGSFIGLLKCLWRIFRFLANEKVVYEGLERSDDWSRLCLAGDIGVSIGSVH